MTFCGDGSDGRRQAQPRREKLLVEYMMWLIAGPRLIGRYISSNRIRTWVAVLGSSLAVLEAKREEEFVSVCWPGPPWHVSISSSWLKQAIAP